MVHQDSTLVCNQLLDDQQQQEKRIVTEFCHLLEKSKQLFNGLRDLPSYGHKQWQTYFGRAFDIYTKLWKFQQINRLVLDKYYNLKRWQIGEIASKIGQLYYHYYLRTSETNYLHEAFQFYGAIRARGYYTSNIKDNSIAVEANNPELLVKKLRYLARFIVVCLLLKRIKNVKELIRELSSQIDDYVASYEPDDQLEWSIVLSEIKTFIDSDSPVRVLDAVNSEVTLTHRLTNLTTPPVEKTAAMNLQLEEIIIVGNRQDQAKFSELTMDMFRILQTLEREPVDEGNNNGAVVVVGGTNGAGVVAGAGIAGVGGSTNGAGVAAGSGTSAGAAAGATKRDNPHKQMLFRPNIDTLLTYLTCSWKDVQVPHGVLLLYLSCDEIKFQMDLQRHVQGYDSGGVAAGKKNEMSFNDRFSIEMQCLYPGDLTVYTRKPLFLIVDSENSTIFQELTSPFGCPVLILMSPEQLPTYLQEIHPVRGSLYTLFLHSPLSGFCSLSNIDNLPFGLWEIGLTYIDRFMAEASRILCRNCTDDQLLQFFGDDFLRLMILRHVFCSLVLNLHKSFQSKMYQPSSNRIQLNIESDHLNHLILDLANHLGVQRDFFMK